MARVTEVAPGIYQVSVLRAGVTVLAEGGRVVLLDAGLRSSAEAVLDFLASKGFKPDSVSHILITHYHPDHIGGLARLQKATGARVGAHPIEAPAIAGDRPLPNPAANEPLRSVFALAAPLLRPRPVAVDLLLEEGTRLDVMGGLEVVHTPGHTPGSLSFFLPARKMLFAGDALQRWWGHLGLPSGIFTQDMEQAEASIRRLAQMDIEALCFSHFAPVMKGAKKELEELADRL